MFKRAAAFLLAMLILFYQAPISVQAAEYYYAFDPELHEGFVPMAAPAIPAYLVYAAIVSIAGAGGITFSTTVDAENFAREVGAVITATGLTLFREIELNLEAGQQLGRLETVLKRLPEPPKQPPPDPPPNPPPVDVLTPFYLLPFLAGNIERIWDDIVNFISGETDYTETGFASNYNALGNSLAGHYGGAPVIDQRVGRGPCGTSAIHGSITSVPLDSCQRQSIIYRFARGVRPSSTLVWGGNTYTRSVVILDNGNYRVNVYRNGTFAFHALASGTHPASNFVAPPGFIIRISRNNNTGVVSINPDIQGWTVVYHDPPLIRPGGHVTVSARSVAFSIQGTNNRFTSHNLTEESIRPSGFAGQLHQPNIVNSPNFTTVHQRIQEVKGIDHAPEYINIAFPQNPANLPNLTVEHVVVPGTAPEVNPNPQPTTAPGTDPGTQPQPQPTTDPDEELTNWPLITCPICGTTYLASHANCPTCNTVTVVPQPLPPTVQLPQPPTVDAPAELGFLEGLFIGDMAINMPDFHGPNNNFTAFFPFSIPWDFANLITALNAPGAPPYFSAHIPEPFNYYFSIDFADYENLASVFRWGTFIVFCMGLIIMTRKLISW